MLQAINLVKTYPNGEEKLYALNQVSFEIKDSEFVVILGPSGSGKSTLLNAISGLETVDSGSIKYDGKELCGLSDSKLTEFRRATTAYVFQSYYLLPHFNVDKNVKMGADLARNQNYREIIEAVGLGEKMNKMPSELSGGEQQRVSIARALAKKPMVLFLDEPTGALDEESGRQVLDHICTLQKELGFSIVMVTHNANIAEMANTVVKMNSGKIVETHVNESQKTAYEIGW